MVMLIGLGKFCFTFQGVIAGLLVQNTLKFLLGFGQVSPYLVSTAVELKHPHLFSFFIEQMHIIPSLFVLKIENRNSLMICFLVCRDITLLRIFSQLCK